MQVIRPPDSFRGAVRPWVFLAGSIEMGGAPRWQDGVVAGLRQEGFSGTVLNPRRDAWDDSWQQSVDDPRFCEQVEWELTAQEGADLILMYFAPDTKCPVTLLELGLSASGRRLVVCCPDGFWRKGNVDLVCRRYRIRQVETLTDLAAVAGQILASQP